MLVTEEISQVIFRKLVGLDFHRFLALPGPSPRLLPGFYRYFRGDFQDSERKTYQKPIRKNKEKNKKIRKNIKKTD